MKLFLTAIALFAAISVRAQYVPSTPAEDAMQTHILQRMAPSRQDLLTLQPPPPNQVTINGHTYNGSIVEMVKTRQPLEMINPAAPPEYGTAEDNTVIDFSGRGTGLKLFAIQF
jgi:hypothetical protein